MYHTSNLQFIRAKFLVLVLKNISINVVIAFPDDLILLFNCSIPDRNNVNVCLEYHSQITDSPHHVSPQ